MTGDCAPHDGAMDEKPRIVALLCENDALPALDKAAAAGKTWNPWVRIIPIRCLGSLNLVWIADTLSRGIDGVIMFGCKTGDLRKLAKKIKAMGVKLPTVGVLVFEEHVGAGRTVDPAAQLEAVDLGALVDDADDHHRHHPGPVHFRRRRQARGRRP